MDLKQHEDGEARFAAYVEGLASVWSPGADESAAGIIARV